MVIEQMLRQIKRGQFWRQKWILIFLVSNLLLNIINWLYCLLSLKDKSKIIPLHSSFIFGVDRVGPKLFILEIPFWGLIIFILNFIFALSFFERGKRIIAGLFLMSALILQIIFFASSILVINL